MEITTDIIIIGAGPAGSICALLLAEKYNVTIIEIKKLPRQKSCSGVLIKKSVDIVRRYFGDIPESVMCSPQKTTGLNIINSAGNTYKFSDDGINILRDKFDFWLLETAKNKGVQVFEESSIFKVQEKNNKHHAGIRRKSDSFTLISKALIACDGILGNSRRLAKAPKLKKIISIQRFYKGMMNLDPSKFYSYTSPIYSQYDAWINSKNEEIIIGSIGFDRKSAEIHLNRFIDYLAQKENFKLSASMKEEVWALPFVLPEIKFLFQYNNFFFAGEAAGLLNPFGEGISSALISGIYLAESLLESKTIDFNEVANIENEYVKKMNKEICYTKRQWDLLRKISPDFYRNTLKCYKNSRKIKFSSE